jgi:hypothetical protein
LTDPFLESTNLLVAQVLLNEALLNMTPFAAYKFDLCRTNTTPKTQYIPISTRYSHHVILSYLISAWLSVFLSSPSILTRVILTAFRPSMEVFSKCSRPRPETRNSTRPREGSCLRGDENMHHIFINMKVRFSKLLDLDGAPSEIKRADFGTLDEIDTLTNRCVYETKI